MSFLHPHVLWLLLAPAALLLLALRRRLRRAPSAHPKIPRARLSSGNSSFVIRHSSLRPPRPLAAAAALALAVLALARPQGAELPRPVVTEARDVLVAVDVSRSMLTDDVSPSRLERARLLVRTLADELRGERLGLLPFAGSAFLQSPLSADYEIFRTFLDELGPDMIPAGGSDFTALLTVAEESLTPPGVGADSTLADRYLVVLTDGEAQDDTWRPVAERLARRGVRIIALGVGTAAGAMVPDGKGGFAKDERGAAVLSRLNPATLQELARLTDGAYRDASAWIDLPALLRETIARGRAARGVEETSAQREELFAWFLAPALALLALSLVREFPIFAMPARVLAAPPAHSPTPRAARPAPLAARALPLLLAVSAALALAPRTPAEPAAADPLVDLVGQLAAGDTLSAADLARLARLTAERGETARQSSAPLPKGALQDALAAVTQGEAADPRAADWPQLRSRLDQLLAPPPQPPKSDPQKSDESKNQDPKPEDQKSADQKPEDQKTGDPKNSPPKSGDSSEKPGAPQNSEQAKSDAQNSPQNANAPTGGSPAAPKAPSQPALGELADKPPTPDEKNSAASSTTQPAPEEKPAEPTQRVGGVSASGQPDGDAADAARLDPALAVPRQRLERVRESDAPARLFQLLQEAETPPDAVRRAPGSPARDW